MIIVVLYVAMLVVIGGLTLYVWGERRRREGYAMGRDAARIKNPQRTIIASETTGADLSRSREGGDNL